MDFTALLNLYSNVFVQDLARYAIGAGGVHIVVNLALRRVLAARQIRTERPGATQICREIATSIRTVAIFAGFGTLIGLMYRAGYSQVYFDIAEWGWGWLVASTLILIVVQDAWFYWAHRLMHRPRLFRRLHRVHHKSHNPTAFTAYSFNAGEAAVHAVYLPFALAVIPAHPIAIFAFTAHMILRNAMGHCGVELFPARRDGRPLFGWLTTVTHHDLHHANARWNMGLYFTWWDRWGGTEHHRYHAEFARVAGRVRGGLLAPVLALAVLGAVAAPDAARAEGLSGDWAFRGFTHVVRFQPCGAAVCGRILFSWEPEHGVHLGRGEVMLRLVRDGEAWRGTLIDPQSGRRFKGTLTRIDRYSLQLRGCAGPFCARERLRSMSDLRPRLAALLP